MSHKILWFRIKLTLIVVLLFALLDWYTWRGLKQMLRNYAPAAVKRIRNLYFGITVLVLVLLTLVFFVPSLSDGPMRFVNVAAFIMLSGKIVFSLFILANDLISLISKIATKVKVPAVQSDLPDKKGITRGDFLHQAGVMAGLAPVVIFSRGIISGAYDYRIRSTIVPIKNLPHALQGLRIVQISDIHSGSFFDKDAVWEGVRMINRLSPDVFFFTGDLVNSKASEFDDYLEVFAEIKAKAGSFSIMGNHDYGDYEPGWGDEEKAENVRLIAEHHKNAGWEILKNEHRTLNINGAKLGIIGVENWGAKARFPKYGDLELATRNMPQVDARILLSHDPSHWDAQVRPMMPEIDLTLSGHTHGMQFGIENSFIKWSPVQYLYKQWAGHYTEGNQHLYVNRGYGFIGYPGRVGIMPEITMITLQKA